MSLLGLSLLLAAIYLALTRYGLGRALKLPDWIIEKESLWFLIPLALLTPLAMTMALLWKTKEVILDGVFGPKRV